VDLGNENLSKMVAKKNVEEVVCRFSIYHTYADMLKVGGIFDEPLLLFVMLLYYTFFFLLLSSSLFLDYPLSSFHFF
jgi:hypothetical protein